MKTWGLFLISIGALIIMLAPLSESTRVINIVFGVIVAVLGYIVFKKGKDPK